ncbi:MAG: D-alanine--D-alanine ligase [Lachnospiraceae bacterium]|jgi:D-alanine-D-alanine ligase|nr:D-alanine--D-alanine ligase [Lachnospiraceae bacterium]MCI9660330.1 D-alanine--D-alanine ligase [Lachnospiraceae bacterium]
MKIVVLAGGISTEREISVVSGTKVCEALRAKGHRAILLDVYFGLEGADVDEAFTEEYDIAAAAAYIRSFDSRVEASVSAGREFFGPRVLALCKEADMVFMALHGENGENGKVQAAFDLFGIHYTGSGYLGSALAMDKGLSKQIFRENGIPTPESVLVHRSEPRKTAEEYGMAFPCVVKTCCGGSSVGVYITEDEAAFADALEEAFTYEPQVVLETYIRGREFSVGVVDGKPYPIIEIAPLEGFYDYKNKYEPGSTIETCPACLSEEQTEKMQEYAVRAYEALRLESYGRIDFLMDEDGKMFCLEANTLPGMTPTSLLPQEAAVMGIGFAKLCETLIQVSKEKKFI